MVSVDNPNLHNRYVHVLDQNEVWIPNDSSGEIPLEQLEPGHQLNLLRFLEDHAASFADQYWIKLLLGEHSPLYFGPYAPSNAYGLEEAIQEEIDFSLTRPVEWIKGKPLYKRLAEIVEERESRPGKVNFSE